MGLYLCYGLGSFDLFLAFGTAASAIDHTHLCMGPDNSISWLLAVLVFGAPGGGGGDDISGCGVGVLALVLTVGVVVMLAIVMIIYM